MGGARPGVPSLRPGESACRGLARRLRKGCRAGARGCGCPPEYLLEDAQDSEAEAGDRGLPGAKHTWE